MEATRQQLAESRDRKLAEVRALFGEAAREAQRARERLDRVRRDYQDGKLEADDWAEQRDQLTGELDAAGAEADRLRDQEQEVTTWGEMQDAEADMLRMLADLRRAIAGEVQDAEGIDAVRAALTRLFERLILHVPGSNWFRHDDIKPSIRAGSLEGVMHIELVVRETAVVEGEGISPVIRREPLQQAENNQRRSSVPS